MGHGRDAQLKWHVCLNESWVVFDECAVFAGRETSEIVASNALAGRRPGMVFEYREVP